MGRIGKALLGLGLAILAWAVVSSLSGGNDPIFPTPWQVLLALRERAFDGSLLIGTLLSFRRLVFGYVLALVVGASVGLIMASSGLMRQMLSPLVAGLQALPSICWLPLALLWFGLSDTAILFVIVLGASQSIAIAIDAGCRHVEPLYIRAARTMGASGFTLYRRVILPAALPEILTGMRLGWAFAWRSLMAGELLFVTGGLGHLLQTGRELGDTAQVVAMMAVIMTLGILSEHFLFAKLQDELRVRWGRSKEA